ncbi:hypothetical protein BIW11_04350 [Tropilaelaps mercedesae]|uniref:Uncharacterized protein n=1 Tax=Tropilaelaps mercedesae TaxID=418985 RepID=A0A1V9X7M5_9ACAR|nr:hypothetical protein BIW11_04350 [Tropilaelaps mercedesae]
MTFSVVFSFVLQIIVQGIQPTYFAIGGGLLIVIAMIIGNAPCGSGENQDLLKQESMPASCRYGTMSSS